jgi:K+-transporting ATPase c subunit
LPSAFTEFGKLAFPFQAGGSLIEKTARSLAPPLIGQNFTSAKYFAAAHPR